MQFLVLIVMMSMSSFRVSLMRALLDGFFRYGRILR
jgi:hypothetical protein